MRKVGPGLDTLLEIRHARPESNEAMSDPRDPTKTAGKRPLFLLLAGFLAGTAMGVALDGAWLSRSATPDSKVSADENVITFKGKTTPGDSSSAMLTKLLESSESTSLERSREMLALVDGLEPGELETRINEFFARRKGNEGYVLIGNLYSRWVETDREGALNHARSLEGKDRKTALSSVLQAWAGKEPREVLAWVKEHGVSVEGRGAVYTALRTMAVTNPEEAIAAAESGGYALMGGMNPSFIYSIWAETDPRAAATHALLISKSTDRKNALSSLASQWAAQDPTVAWNWANGLERIADRNAAVSGLIGQIAGNSNSTEAIAFLEKMPPGKGREEALGRIASNLAQFDPKMAFDLIQARSASGNREQAYSGVFYQWAQHDPETAFRTAFEELDPGSARKSAIQYSLDGIAKRDPERAASLFDTLDDDTKSGVVYSLARALAESSHDLAMAWAEALPNGETKENAYSNIFSLWAENDPEAALGRGLGIENKSLRHRSLSSVLGNWAQNDPVEAMTWAVKNLGTEDQESIIPGQLLRNWTRHDIESAADWVAALPEGNLREKSVPTLVSTWADRDLIAAGEWLKTIPKGRVRDLAAERYAGRVFSTDPEAALAWAESIGAEAMRVAQVGALAGRYLKHEPEKAKRWIANSSLPPERQAELLKAAAQN